MLAAIRREWGSEEAFDEYVHTHLVDILAMSKRMYSYCLLNLVSQTLDQVFDP